jgi:hypothetical protein
MHRDVERAHAAAALLQGPGAACLLLLLLLLPLVLVRLLLLLLLLVRLLMGGRQRAADTAPLPRLHGGSALAPHGRGDSVDVRLVVAAKAAAVPCCVHGSEAAQRQVSSARIAKGCVVLAAGVSMHACMHARRARAGGVGWWLGCGLAFA